MKIGKTGRVILIGALSIVILCGVIRYLPIPIFSDSPFDPVEIAEIKQDFPYYAVPPGYVEISASTWFGIKTIAILPENVIGGNNISITLLGRAASIEDAKISRTNIKDGFGAVCVSEEEIYLVSSKRSILNNAQSEVKVFEGGEKECGYSQRLVIYYFKIEDIVGTIDIFGAIDEWDQEAIDYLVESFNNPP